MKRIKVSFEVVVSDDFDGFKFSPLAKDLELWVREKRGFVHLIDGMKDTLVVEEMK